MNNFVHLSTEFAKETLNDLKDLIALAGADPDIEFQHLAPPYVLRSDNESDLVDRFFSSDVTTAASARLLKYLEESQFFTADSLGRLKAAAKKRQQDVEEMAWMQNQTPNPTREAESSKEETDTNAEEDAGAEVHLGEAKEKDNEVGELFNDFDDMTEADFAAVLEAEAQNNAYAHTVPGLINVELPPGVSRGWELMALGHSLTQGHLKDVKGAYVEISTDVQMEQPISREEFFHCLDASGYEVIEKEFEDPQLVQNMLQLLQDTWGPQEEDDGRIQDFTGPGGDERQRLAIRRELCLKKQTFVLLCFKDDADVYGQPHVVGVAWLKEMWHNPGKAHKLEDHMVAFDPRKSGNPGVFKDFAQCCTQLVAQHGDIEDVFVIRKFTFDKNRPPRPVRFGQTAADSLAPTYLAAERMVRKEGGPSRQHFKTLFMEEPMHVVDGKKVLNETVLRMVNDKQEVRKVMQEFRLLDV